MTEPTKIADALGAALRPKHCKFAETYFVGGMNATAAAREMK